MAHETFTRREAAARVAALLAPSMAPARLAPRDQLVNVLEYEEQAKAALAPSVHALIAGGDRTAFDRITLRPRMLVPTLDLDLGVTLLGDTHFAPVIIGPIADQRQFHPDGELATVAGASSAKAAVVVSSRSSVPLRDVASKAGTPVWYQLFASEPNAKTLAQEAVAAGCRAICVTIGASPAAGKSSIVADTKVNWAAVDAIARDVKAPVLVKGITTADAARTALAHGAAAVIVSNYRGTSAANGDAAVVALPAIVDAVSGRAPVLADGSFRRGTDILKALAFGAKAVLVGRPVMWGLAAYGAAGVQGVVEMLQTELARYMAMCGKTSVQALDRSMLRVHAPVPGKT
jgi:isopentenyl diphosphate isomerase/L-lactate dehydrogenase-like FMN-dependent dehydrogenase